jgi:hypothetical protein
MANHINSSLQTDENEQINKPTRYGGDDCMKAIESAGWGSEFCAGNVVKYVWRYRHKGGVADLKKAKWYLERLIQLEESES